jgi:hypothetical protein
MFNFKNQPILKTIEELFLKKYDGDYFENNDVNQDHLEENNINKSECNYPGCGKKYLNYSRLLIHQRSHVSVNLIKTFLYLFKFLLLNLSEILI